MFKNRLPLLRGVVVCVFVVGLCFGLLSPTNDAYAGKSRSEHDTPSQFWKILGVLNSLSGLEARIETLEAQNDDQQDQIDELYDRIEDLQKVVIRFTHMGDGTIRDNATGLIWLKDATCGDLNGINKQGRADWPTAMQAAAELADGTCGLTDGSKAGDWRLPTKEEWEAFVSIGYKDPALVNTVGDAQWSEGDAFTGVQADNNWSVNYWSSTEYDSDTDNAYNVYMGRGNTRYDPKTAVDYYVWPVRSDSSDD